MIYRSLNWLISILSVSVISESACVDAETSSTRAVISTAEANISSTGDLKPPAAYCRKFIGLTRPYSSLLISKWRWGPEDLPVEPIVPMMSPWKTLTPQETFRVLK